MRTFVVRELKKVKDMYSVYNSVGEVSSYSYARVEC